ncbi:MAG: hypothetical protein HYX69_02740 [Planctomycetia bacterium]|nr:hypothetical protein [Planctomycetia bacterium]
MRSQLPVLALVFALAVSATSVRGQEPESADETWVEDVQSPPPRGAGPTRVAPEGPPAENPWGDSEEEIAILDKAGDHGGPEHCGPDACGQECLMQCCQRTPVWAHLTGGFGSYLFLRPRYTEVPFAVPIDGAIVPPVNPPIQVGPTGVIDPNYSSGFRAGFNKSLGCYSSVRATYTHYENSEANAISTDAPNVIRSLVSHPSTLSSAQDFLSAAATSSINFQFADVDYRGLFSYGPRHALNYVAGIRYAHLNQDFGALFSNNGTETVTSAVNFDGGGIRVGLEGDFVCRHGLMLYGRSAASFVAGQFRANYVQGQSFDPIVVNTSWHSGRLVSILDLELGVGWTSPNQRVRFRAGYLVMGWFNAVKTVDFISAVQQNNFTQLSNPFSFDGLTATGELRF